MQPMQRPVPARNAIFCELAHHLARQIKYLSCILYKRFRPAMPHRLQLSKLPDGVKGTILAGVLSV
jgi:hypothetical protein